MSSVLLQQMEKMLSSWDAVGSASSPEPSSGAQLYKIETCRAALALFISGAGPYRPLLERMFKYLFETVDALTDKANRAVALPAQSGADLPIVSCGSDTVALILHKDDQMQKLRTDVRTLRDQQQDELHQLRLEKDHVEQLLKHQMLRTVRSQHLDAADNIQELVRRALNEKRVDEIEAAMRSLSSEVDEAKKSAQSLRQLNARYASQAVELVARLRVVTEHNRRIASLLAFQQHDVMEFERASETLRSELAAQQATTRILQETTEVVQPSSSDGAVGPREVIYGLGLNRTVPRHLAFRGMITRRRLAQQMTVHIVSEFFASWRSRGEASFHAHLAAFLQRKYGSDATSYAYALDAAAREYFDSDIPIQLFGLVSSGTLCERVFDMASTELKVFLEACEALAAMRPRIEGAELEIPVMHILQLIVHMFPSYGDGVIAKLADALSEVSSSHQYVFFGALFPESHLQFVAPNAGTKEEENPAETAFSLLFKRTLIEDLLITTQQLEDSLVEKELASIDDVCSVVSTLYSEETMNRILPSLRDILMQCPGYERYDTVLSTRTVVRHLRGNALFRRGPTAPARPLDRTFILKNALKEWNAAMGNEPIPPVDFDELFTRMKNKRRDWTLS